VVTLRAVLAWCLAAAFASLAFGAKPAATAAPATTLAGCAASGYDVSAITRNDAQAIGVVDADPGLVNASRGRSDSPLTSTRGTSTTPSLSLNATNTGSALSVASSAAFRAADDPASIFIKNKHLASAGGNHAKFASESISEVQGWVAQGLRSDGVQFLPNQVDGTFRAIVPAGQVVGTRGQTFIRVIVTDDGRVINAFPVMAG
jgi:hypothetical protein